jgi:hypothetical protein
VTFHELRGTAPTRLALARATVPEIVAITGHRLSEASRILDGHCLHKDPQLGANAIANLEANVRGTRLRTAVEAGRDSRNFAERRG